MIKKIEEKDYCVCRQDEEDMYVQESRKLYEDYLEKENRLWETYEHGFRSESSDERLSRVTSAFKQVFPEENDKKISKLADNYLNIFRNKKGEISSQCDIKTVVCLNCFKHFTPVYRTREPFYKWVKKFGCEI